LRRLDLIVGPNGSGKTTFVAHFLAPVLPGAVFVNADEIARARWPDDPASHAYDAARVARGTRAALIAAGRSFIAETVFSHSSKVLLVRDAARAGYTVFMHVLMVPEDLAVARVEFRVRAGGHAVPEGKIRARHRRLWAHVAAAAPLADGATFYDNSHHDGPRIVAQITAGLATGRGPWPDWTPGPLLALTGADAL
jgi:predicted ABC-type ATPase